MSQFLCGFSWWDCGYAWEVLPALVKALKVTVSATLVGFALATVLGLVLAIARRSRLRIVSALAGGFITFVRNTPLLPQLYFLFFALPNFGLSPSAFTVGVMGLGMHYSTYMAEVFRSGIEAVPRGQWEAATAINFSRLQTWTRIILPQAIPPVVPVLGNYLIVMFKETPLLSAISLVEIVQTAKILGSQSLRYIEPMTIVGILFLLVSYPAAILVRRLELRLKRQHRVSES